MISFGEVGVGDYMGITGDGKVGIGTELEFHRSIAEATENPVIMRIVPVIMDAIVKTYSDAPRTSDDHRQALLEHIKIYEGIKERDPANAFQAMSQHLENSYQRTMSKRAKTKQK